VRITRAAAVTVRTRRGGAFFQVALREAEDDWRGSTDAREARRDGELPTTVKLTDYGVGPRLGILTRRGYNQGSPHSGPEAQLGARMNGIHEVTGSIPVWSTNLSFSSPIGCK
jgi:hypothetical protein